MKEGKTADYIVHQISKLRALTCILKSYRELGRKETERERYRKTGR